MTTEVITGRYSENGMSPGDVIEFVPHPRGGTMHRLYPPGVRMELHQSGRYISDEEEHNGHDAAYILVSSKASVSRVKGIARFLKEHNL